MASLKERGLRAPEDPHNYLADGLFMKIIPAQLEWNLVRVYKTRIQN